jgi:hypothetical protein
LERQPAKAKQVGGSSRRMPEPEPDMPPLFCPDPEENFSLWMQNCFPNASLVREHPIRQWLGSPLEVRVERNHNHPAKSATSHDSEMTGAAQQEARDGARSNENGTGNPKRQSGWNSQLKDGNQEDPFAYRFAFWTRSNSALRSKFARYLVLALAIVVLFWATPTSHVPSLPNVSIAATQTTTTKLAAAATMPVTQGRAAIGAGPDFATGQTTIENISVGCKNTEPCIEISIRGKATLPKLSTLSDPDRVVMDFENAMLSSNVHRIKVGRDGVKAIRIAENGAQPPCTRVVIDLMEKCDYELHTVTDGVILTIHCKAAPHQAG